MNGSHHQSPDSDSHSECDSISNPNHSTTQDWRLESTLEQELAEWKKLGLERRIRNLESTQGTHIKLNGRNIINFSSNNYLGISNHPEVVSRLQSDALLYGSGAGSSRLVCGSQAPHQELESLLCEWKHTPACLTFTSGYAAAVGTIPALVGSGDVVILDKLSHACLIDGAKLSGAKLRVFPHNDIARLETILQWANQRRDTGNKRSRILIVTESVFSMDGDFAPLSELVALKEKYRSWLMVDEAHASGMYGSNGSGRIAESGLQNVVEVQMGTLSKALGVAGGYIAGSHALIQTLVHQARSFVFSTGVPPSTAAAAAAAVRLIKSEQGEALRDQLWRVTHRLKTILNSVKKQNASTEITADNNNPPLLNTSNARLSLSPILPWIVGEAKVANEISSRLLDEFGILVPAIRYPTVPRGAARLRFTASAEHSDADLDALASALQCISTAQDPIPGR